MGDGLRWELTNEEFIQFTDPLGRVELFGGKFDIELSLAERFYLAGKLAMWTMPTARPLLVAKDVGTVLRGVDDVLANPQLLQGRSLNEAKNLIGESKGWVNDVMRRSTTNPNGG